jgi:hypothetical protein
MIWIIDNNEVINEFNKLIEPDLLYLPDDKQDKLNYWSLKTVTFVSEFMQEVKILLYFFCRADKIRQF